MKDREPFSPPSGVLEMKSRAIAELSAVIGPDQTVEPSEFYRHEGRFHNGSARSLRATASPYDGLITPARAPTEGEAKKRRTAAASANRADLADVRRSGSALAETWEMSNGGAKLRLPGIGQR